MHEFFKGYTSPGRLSEAYRTGMETQEKTHTGGWDRNPLMVAMLEIKLSMTGHGLDMVEYDALTLYDRICGGAPNRALGFYYQTGSGPAGYRVPTSAKYDPQSSTYDDGDVPVTDFAPIVGFGSLEMLRSQYLEQLHMCVTSTRTGRLFGEEDAMTSLWCGEEDAQVVDDLRTRGLQSPSSLQRNVWCDASAEVSIEQTVGNPEEFDEFLYDTELQSARYINNMVVRNYQRGEENLHDKTWVKRNLRSWVYVTSSADSNIRAGMYRLMDVALFRDEQCNELHNVQCSNYWTPTFEELAATVLLTPLFGFLNFFDVPISTSTYKLRPKLTIRQDRLNHDKGLSDDLTSVPLWLNGRRAVLKHRCSALVDRELGAPECKSAPYDTYTGNQGFACSNDDLRLVSRPTKYGSGHWVFRLKSAPSPSPPPPPPTPHPPPKPPSPCPPSSPPYKYDQFEVMAAIRDAEERACTSVYYLPQTTRCERLAISLTTRWLMEFARPPGVPPPIGTSPSPPPPPPPSPSLPTGIVRRFPIGTTLSTYRMPVALPSGKELDAFGFYHANLTALRTQARATEQERRACVPDAPLACVTGVLEEQCLNGGRRCGTREANYANPWVEMRFTLTRKHYLWAIVVTLPRKAELAKLFVGPKKVEVFGDRNTPLPCAEGDHAVAGVPDDYTLTIVCHPPTATDDELYLLSSAHRLRITLTGVVRKIWLEDLSILERPLAAVDGIAAASPPPLPPPPVPLAAPTPGAPTVGGSTPCDFKPNRWIDAAVSMRRVHEPCGMDDQECCQHKKEREPDGADAFELDDAGCCNIIYLDGNLSFVDGIMATDVDRHGAWSSRSGTGK